MSKQRVTSRTTHPASRRKAHPRWRTAVAGAALALMPMVLAGAWAATRGGDTSTTREALHADTRLGTVELRVSDLDEQRSFYEAVLGLDLLEETDDTVRLGAAGQELIRLVRTDAPQPAPTEAGLYHSAILYPDPASLAAVLEQVATLAPESYAGASDHTVSRAFYLSDPEGNGVELYVDRPRDSWDWDGGSVRMGSAPLNPNAFIADNRSDAPVAAPTVGHVHLKVGDLDDARRFYVDALGFKLTSESDGAIFMAAGGYHHHLAANTWNSDGAGVRASTAGLGSFQVLLPTDGDVEALAERLNSAGQAFERTQRGLAVDDPWGNAVTVAIAPVADATGTP